MANQDKLNSLIHSDLAEIVNQEVRLPNVLITILKAEADDRVSYIKITISVLPNKFYGSALESLRKHNKVIAYRLQKKSKLKRVPKIFWALDTGSKNEQVLEAIFRQIAEE